MSYPTLTRNRSASKLKPLTPSRDLHLHSRSALVDRLSDKIDGSDEVLHANVSQIKGAIRMPFSLYFFSSYDFFLNLCKCKLA